MPIAITYPKSKRNWQKSNTNLKNKKECSPPMTEYSISKNKWLFSDNKPSNSTINLTKKHKKTNSLKGKSESLKNNNSLSMQKKNKRSES